MRSIIIVLSLVVLSATGCKSKKEATSTTGSASTSVSSSTTTSSSTMGTSTTETTTSAQGNNQGAFVGRVSHKYREGGCATVIIITGEAGETILIPKDKLSDDVDTDGQLIKFDYRALKMPQPAGCTTGIPAEITNINKMK